MYKFLYKSIFQFIDAEKMHTFAIFILRYFSKFLKVNLPFENANFFETKIKNKIGIAAGFDKNGQVIKGLFNLGFGFVEIGTVTPKAQQGNPRPRIFRLKNEMGIINKMGFPNRGSDFVLTNLKKFNKVKQPYQVVGVNIGKNKEGGEDDYLLLIEKFINDADYIAINISSPNTPNLRDLLKEESLAIFLNKIKEKREMLRVKKPFFLKISPDIAPSDLSYIYNLIVKNNIEGIIISNTTVNKPADVATIEGGLSGKLLKEASFELLKEFNKLNKNNIIVISVGGVESKQDVVARLNNGANFVQVYTSLIFTGPKLLKTLV